MGNKEYSLGLVSVSFRQHTPQEILDAMNRVGLSFIEWGSDVHAPCDNIYKLKEIAMLQKKYGIKCSSYGTYFRFDSTLQELESYINAAKILETNVLRLWCGKKSGADMTNEERISLMNDCKKAAKLAEANDVTLCLECHKKTFTENPKDSVLLMNEVNSKNFRMYWQPFQWQNADDNLKNAELIAPYTKHIHVFNWKDEKKLPLRDAIGEWQKYLEVFSDKQTLLLEFMPNGTLGELEDEAAALRKIIGE